MSVKIKYECQLKWNFNHLEGRVELKPCDGKGVFEISDEYFSNDKFNDGFIECRCEKCGTKLHKTSGNFEILDGGIENNELDNGTN